MNKFFSWELNWTQTKTNFWLMIINIIMVAILICDFYTYGGISYIILALGCAFSAGLTLDNVVMMIFYDQLVDKNKELVKLSREILNDNNELIEMVEKHNSFRLN